MQAEKDKVALVYEVYETTDYDKFKHMEGNRDIDTTHVKSLARKMEREGNLMPEFPIEVNEHLFILDGQHRNEAARINSMKVYYRIIPNGTISTTIARNTGNQNWRWLDYAKSWAKRGNNEYREFVRLYNEYHLNFGILLAYAMGTTTMKSGIQSEDGYVAFKEGRFMFRDLSLTKKLIKQYAELSDVADINLRNFAYAAHSIMRTPGYDHEFMVKRIMAVGDGLHRCYTITDFLMELESIQRA